MVVCQKDCRTLEENMTALMTVMILKIEEHAAMADPLRSLPCSATNVSKESLYHRISCSRRHNLVILKRRQLIGMC